MHGSNSCLYWFFCKSRDDLPNCVIACDFCRQQSHLPLHNRSIWVRSIPWYALCESSRPKHLVHNFIYIRSFLHCWQIQSERHKNLFIRNLVLIFKESCCLHSPVSWDTKVMISNRRSALLRMQLLLSRSFCRKIRPEAYEYSFQVNINTLIWTSRCCRIRIQHMTH